MTEETSLERDDDRRKRSGCGRTLIIVVVGLLALCFLAAGLSALSNLTMPDGTESTDRLSSLDKARLAETLNLKQELGETVWPGWGAAEVPVLIWNRDYSYLVGFEEAPPGWSEVANDEFQGQPYFSRPTDEHENFAVRIGDRWVASMATKLETDLFVREMIKDALPLPFKQIVPYRLLIQPSEVQMSGVLHESFHVFQVQEAQARFDDAERAYVVADSYWSVDEAMHEAWQREIELLEQALAAASDREAAAFADQFLGQRSARRSEGDLSSELVNFERRFEWLEGLAKYVELEIWRQAANDASYTFVPEMANDPDFREYGTFDSRWTQEIDQMNRQASREGDTRFYYTGMAQAKLLDRLLPDWKGQIMDDDVWLEDLLLAGVEGAS
jgi:hypothetical protein